MILLYTCENLIEAQQIMHALEEHNIEAQLINQNLSGAMGEIPFTETWPKIHLVNEQDEPEARKILEDLKELEKKSTRDHFCNKCGERNPGNFASCWNCNADLN